MDARHVFQVPRFVLVPILGFMPPLFAVFLSSVFVQIEGIESCSHSLFMLVLIKSPLVLISSGFYVVVVFYIKRLYCLTSLLIKILEQ